MEDIKAKRMEASKKAARQRQVKMGIEDQEDDDEIEPSEKVLEATEATKYRALVARANYLPGDRGDIAFAVKELARRMSRPDVDDRRKLERLAKYLAHKPRCLIWFRLQERPEQMVVLY